MDPFDATVRCADTWMRAAIAQARAAVAAGQTPFGAVIVRLPVEADPNDAREVASGHNEVWLRRDPTAHAEIVAIQRAAERLGTIDLRGCMMFTTCEPCPMCATAIHWARLDAVCHGASIADALRAGFNELNVPIAELYRTGSSPVRILPGVLRAECAQLFADWKNASRAAAY